MKLWWLSYADEEGHRGIVVAEGRSMLEAAFSVRERGLSPGGEALGFLIPDRFWDRFEGHLYRLMNREEAETVFGPMKRIPGSRTQ